MFRKCYMMTPPTFRVDLINELAEKFGKCLKLSARWERHTHSWSSYNSISLSNLLIVRNRSNYSAVHEITCSSKLSSSSQPAEHVFKRTYSSHMHISACVTLCTHHMQTPQCPPGCRLETKVSTDCLQFLQRGLKLQWKPSTVANTCNLSTWEEDQEFRIHPR